MPQQVYPPPDAAVLREGGLITQIESSQVNSGETDVSWIDLRGARRLAGFGSMIPSQRSYENGGDKLVHGSGGISQPRAE